LIGLAAWLACTEPATVPECPDAACRRALIEAAADPATAAALIAQVPSPEERLAVVSTLVTANPEGSAALCEALPPGAERHACASVTSRPHLWAKPPPRKQARAAPRTAPGPSSTMPMAVLRSASVFADVEPDAGACTTAADLRACAFEQAVVHARAGKARRSAAVCARIDGQRWGWECNFRAAEATIRARRSAGYADALDLCVGAGEFRPGCVQKIGVGLMALAPASTATAAEWAPVLAAVSTMAAAWQSRDAERTPEVLGAYWSGALAFAYSRSEQVTGDPLDALTDSALVPHIRCAAAHRLLQVAPTAAGDLAGWGAAVSEALARRAPGPAAISGRDLVGLSDYWSRDEGEDGAVPALHAFGVTRRTYAEEPTVDARICVLEAAAQLSPPRDGLLAEGAEDAHASVRWTAERLRRRQRRR